MTPTGCMWELPQLLISFTSEERLVFQLWEPTTVANRETVWDHQEGEADEVGHKEDGGESFVNEIYERESIENREEYFDKLAQEVHWFKKYSKGKQHKSTI